MLPNSPLWLIIGAIAGSIAGSSAVQASRLSQVQRGLKRAGKTVKSATTQGFLTARNTGTQLCQNLSESLQQRHSTSSDADCSRSSQSRPSRNRNIADAHATPDRGRHVRRIRACTAIPQGCRRRTRRSNRASTTDQR